MKRLEASQKACFDAGQHIAAMDIQAARAEIARLQMAYNEAMRLARVAISSGVRESKSC